jgi:hypothetical protein
MKDFRIDDLFDFSTGDYHATKELDEDGDVPLISCGERNNGLVGYYSIPEENRYSHTITVAYNGRPLTAKYHPYEFGAKDDVAVLSPKQDMSKKVLIYIATVLNTQKWRYSYGRKCYKSKFKYVSLPLPVDSDDNLDTEYIESLYDSLEFDIPHKERSNISLEEPRWEKEQISNYFEVQQGDFNALPKENGDMPTISRKTENNGIKGHFKPPEGAEIYEPGKITISTTSGKAFVRLQQFIASDKVVILTPKVDMSLSMLHFFQMMIDYESWRYSYGRSCFGTKVSDLEIYLPKKTDEDSLHRGFAKTVITSAPYWNYVEDHFTEKQKTTQTNLVEM